MKKQLLSGVLMMFLMLGSAFYLLREPSVGNFRLEEKGSTGGINKAQIAREAAKYRLDRLKDENGNFSPTYLTAALNHSP